MILNVSIPQLNRVQFETRRFQFRSSPPWATLEGWYYGFQTGRGLDRSKPIYMQKKKAAHKRRPESREETPKEASAAAMLHCNNDSGRNFVQWERQISGLPLFFAKLRDFGASLSIAPPDRRCHTLSARLL